MLEEEKNRIIDSIRREIDSGSYVSRSSVYSDKYSSDIDYLVDHTLSKYYTQQKTHIRSKGKLPWKEILSIAIILFILLAIIPQILPPLYGNFGSDVIISLNPDSVHLNETLFVNVSIPSGYNITNVSADMAGVVTIGLELVDNSSSLHLWSGNWTVYGLVPDEHILTIFAWDDVNGSYSAGTRLSVLPDEIPENESFEPDKNETLFPEVDDENVTYNESITPVGLNLSLQSDKSVYVVNETVIINGTIMYNNSLINTSVDLSIVGPNLNLSEFVNASFSSFDYVFIPVEVGNYYVKANVSYENDSVEKDIIVVVEDIPVINISENISEVIFVDPKVDEQVYALPGTSFYVDRTVDGPSGADVVFAPLYSDGLTIEKFEILRDNGATCLKDSSPRMFIAGRGVSNVERRIDGFREGLPVDVKNLNRVSYSQLFSLDGPVTVRIWFRTPSWEDIITDVVPSSGRISYLTFTDIDFDFESSTWWDSSWFYRKLITVNSSQVDGDLSNFPILLNITDSDLASKAQDDGDDIAFVLWSDNSTQLNHEIELFNGTTGELLCWINVTSLSSSEDTKIWMYYNNSGSSNQQNTTGVWDSNYIGVWHLNETSGTVYDSTSNNEDSTAVVGVTQDVVGFVDGSDEFDGSSSYIDFNTNLPSKVTISAWATLTGASDMLWVIDSDNQGPDLWFSNGNIYLNTWDGYSNPFCAQPANVNGWHLYTAIIESGNTVLYINYSLDGTANYRDPTGSDFHISSSAGYDWAGRIDEFRISNIARNSSWIITSYNAQTNSSTFITLGSEEHAVPILSNPIPNNGSNNILVPPSSFNITISDPMGDNMNITWRTNESGSWETFNVTDGGGSGVGDGTYNTTNTSWVDSFLTKYWWCVNVTDGVDWTNQTFSFTTKDSTSAPTINNVYPSNGSSDIDAQITCYIQVNDAEEDTMTVYWYNSTDEENFTYQQTNSSVSSGDYVYWTYSQADNLSTTYYWKVAVNDSIYNTTAWYYFTTVPINTSVNPIIPYNVTSSQLVLNATGESVLDKVTLYYRWSSDNFTTLGTGRDGAITITADNTIINNYTYLTGNENSGETTITVNDASEFNIGDEILIIQMQNSSAGISGTYEFTDISSKSGNDITLNSGLANSYYSGTFDQTSSTSAQIVSVPHYTSVTVNSNSNVTASAWDGYNGGIVVFRAIEGVTVDGAINVSGKGYRGGLHGTPSTCGSGEGEQGESYPGKGGCGGYTSSGGENPNGGGGGLEVTGGGGGYGTAGEDSESWDGGGADPGAGGLQHGVANLEQILLGSGGGGCYQGGSGSGDGGDGGGIIMIFANSVSISGGIESRGQNGQGYGTGSYSYGTGGGSGGSIFISATNLSIGNNLINASFGLGREPPGATPRDGGDGGMGRIRLDYVNLTGTTDPVPGYNGSFEDVDSCSWIEWNNANNPDTNYASGGWNWTFDFPNGTGYYEFYCIGNMSGIPNESAPTSPDASCYYIPPTLPVVTTNASTGVEETNATLRGYLSSEGGLTTTCGFRFGTSSGSYSENFSIGILPSGTEFSNNNVSLIQGQIYYYQAWASNSLGFANGSEMTVLTKPDSPTNLIAQTNNTSVIYLSWITGTGANKTYIERNSSGVSVWTRGEGTMIYNDSGTNYEDTSLMEGVTYYYQAWSYANWTYDSTTLYQWSDNNASAINTTDSAPKIDLINPLPNGTTDVSTLPLCQVWANDSDSGTLDVYWYENTTGSYILRNTNSSVSANSNVSYNFSEFSNYSASYYWYVAVNDSKYNITEWFYFSTELIDTSVNTISPYAVTYTPYSITATGPGDLENVTLWYRFSTDNSSWDDWVENTTDSVYPWNWSFDFPNGTGYYEFYSIGNKSGSPNEAAPASADAICYFNVTVNNPPSIVLVNPSPNGTENVSLLPKCQIWANDGDLGTLTVYWYENSSGPYVLRNTNNSVSANSLINYTFSEFNSFSTTYYWKVAVNDSIDNTSSIFYFTTRPENYEPTIEIISPTNGSTGMNTLTTCQIWANDTDGDLLNITWAHNISGSFVNQYTNTSVTANSTVSYQFLDFTNYSRTYYWRVYVHDGTINISKWFSFTTGLINTSIDTISPYSQISSPLTINATGSSSLSNISLWYKYSDDNTTWWNTSWTKSKPIYLNLSSGVTPANYQVLLNITYDSDMNSNFSDLRFVNYSNSSKELDYWVENKSDGNWASIWLELDSPINTTNQSLVWMYYGNPSAETNSNGSNTFEFFENFSGTSLDTNTWSATGSYSVNDGIAITTGAVYTDNTVLSSPQDLTFEMKASYSGPDASYSGLEIADAQSTSGSNGGANALAYHMTDSGGQDITLWGADGTVSSYNIVSGGSLAPNPTLGTYYILGYSFYGSTDISYFYQNLDYSEIDRATYSGTWSDPFYLWLGYFTGSASGGTNIDDIDVSWVRIRKYNSIEPTYSIGIEVDSWTQWNNVSNPDTSSPWIWDFDFPDGNGYYEFYSIGNKSGSPNETAPDSADARCYFFEYNTSIGVTPAQWNIGVTTIGSYNYSTSGFYFNLTNNGTVALNIQINASNATNSTTGARWNLTSTPGFNNYSLQYNKSGGGTWTNINNTYDTFVTNLGVGAWQTFDLNILMAINSTKSDPLSITVTFRSVAS